VSEPLEDEAEVIDGLLVSPVLPEEPSDVGVAPARSRALAIRLAAPVQAATAALGGFLAGVAVVGLLSRRQGKHRRGALARRALPRRALPRGIRVRRRRPERQGGARGVAGELVQVVASRSLLVDVHLLGSSSNER
jgi:hypothetical protein